MTGWNIVKAFCENVGHLTLHQSPKNLHPQNLWKPQSLLAVASSELYVNVVNVIVSYQGAIIFRNSGAHDTINLAWPTGVMTLFQISLTTIEFQEGTW